MFRKRYLSMLFLILPFTGMSQLVSSGKEFFYASWDGGAQTVYRLVSKQAAIVSFHFYNMPSLDFTVTLQPDKLFSYKVPPVQSATYYVTGGGRGNVGGAIERKSVHICSDKNITVSVYNNIPKVDDATLLYPVYQPNIDSTPTFFTVNQGLQALTFRKPTIIISHFDSVKLEITLKKNMGAYTAGVPFQITLNEGETFCISNFGNSMDFSGSKVEVLSAPGRNPVTLIANSESSYINYPWTVPWPNANGAICCADVLLDQILPVSSWDTLYHFVPPLYDSLPGKFMPCVHRIVSATGSNNIYINGSWVGQINAGEMFDTLLSTPSIIRSDRPVSVSLFTPSQSFLNPYSSINTNVGDPDQQWLAPLSSGIKEYIFQKFIFGGLPLNSTINQESRTGLTLITDSSAFSITLDGVSIANNFVPFPTDPRYIYAQLPIKVWDTLHLISDKKVTAYLSSFIVQGGYTYALGDLTTGDTLTAKSQTWNLKFCDTITLSGRDGAKKFLWSTGANSYSIIANTPGTYWVTSDISCIHSITDTFHLSTPVVPVLHLDTIMCPGDTIVLNAHSSQAIRYEWSTGDTTESIKITTPGNYYVTRLPDGKNCPPVYDTINISTFELPELILPDDTALCHGNLMHLGTFQPGMRYLWNTGDTGCCISVRHTGHYEVSVRNFCADSIVRSTNLDFQDCDNCLSVPNAFSPNGDGRNDIFKVLSRCKFQSFHLEVFNRFGEQVFTSYKSDQGWNGSYKGMPADIGVYFYHLTATPLLGDQKQVFKKGDVTLIR